MEDSEICEQNNFLSGGFNNSKDIADFRSSNYILTEEFSENIG